MKTKPENLNTNLQEIELQELRRNKEVEAALEKVRAKSMAMKTSEELGEVSLLLDEQVRSLGIKTRGCAFNIYGENESTEWFSSEMGTLPVYKTPREDIFLRLYEAGQRGESIYIESFIGDVCKKHYEYLCSLPGSGEDLLKFVENGGIFPENQIDHAVYFKYGYLLFITLEPAPAAHEIFKRFAKVFEQTYTRFLDLQKAEAQAREAEIELALERVLTVSMGIKVPKDMLEVCKTISQQLQSLGVKEIRNVQTAIFYENKGIYINYEYYAKHNKTFITEAIYTNHKLSKAFGVKMLKGKGEFFITHFKGKKIKEWLEYQKTTNVFIDKYLNTADSLNYYWYSLGPVALGITTYFPLTIEEENLFKRFLKVFELAYRRYLDIEKAEAQAREAQIEVALERVRSGTMSLQDTEDMKDLVSIVIKQLVGLGFELDLANFNYLSTPKEWRLWMATPDFTYPDLLEIPVIKHPLFDRPIAAFNQGKDFMSDILTEVEFKSAFSHFYSTSKLSFWDDPQRKSYVAKGMGMARSVVFMKNITLTISNFQAIPYSDEQNLILKRFAIAFEQAYIRFLDLQKAEAQAEQAKIDLILIQTEKKRAEDALSELKITQAQLIQKEKLASLGELTAGIAHEIQNPLNFVNNFSEVSEEMIREIRDERLKTKDQRDEALEDELLTDIEQNLQKINHHGQRASSIVKGMLEHSRTSSGKKELTDINALADEYLRLAYHGLRAKENDFNAEMVTDFDPNLPKIEVIPQDIGRVLLNLINNAFQAVGEASRASASSNMASSKYNPNITVSTKTLKEKIEIIVKDNGPGVPDAIKDKIFQPFFTTKDTGKGTGLGLSLAYDIVKAHGGELKLESEENKGASFIIQLPI